MDLRQKMDRFYLDLVLNELRLANSSQLGHLTYNNILYLDIIAYQENCTVTYIADTLHVAKSAVTLKVKELEKLGLVEKVQSPTDKRVFYLSVNQQLLEQYKAYDQVFYRALGEVEESYTDEQKKLLCDMLDTIHRRFQEEAPHEKGRHS